MLNFYPILILSIILLFFRGFVFSFFGFIIPILWLTAYPLFIFYIIKENKHIFNELHILYKNTPFKYLIFFLLWVIVTSIILILTHKATILIFYYIFFKLLPILLLGYCLACLFIPKYLSLKNFIKIFFGITYFILIFGIVGFLGDLLNIEPIKLCTNFISNAKYLSEGTTFMLDSTSGISRARSVFGEPQNLGWFIFMIMPILFKVCLSKYSIYRNKYLNYFIKKTIIPLAYINVIISMSPIATIATIILTIIYFLKDIFYKIKKHFIFIAIFLIILFVCILFLHNIILDYIYNSYLSRIINVILSINSFEKLALVEGSLASRLNGYINSFILFTKHPILGLGFDNTRFYMYQQYMNSPLPLTQENIARMIYDEYTGTGTWFCKATFFTLLADSGIIGTGIFYMFIIKSITVIKNIRNKFVGLQLNFLDGLKLSYIAIFITSIYLYILQDIISCFLFCLLASYILSIREYN